jgi:hypothetical protein
MMLDAKVRIELDTPRTLLLDFNALCQYEEMTGKSAFAFGENVNAKDARVLLWAALLDESPSITLEEVGKLMYGGNLGYIMQKLGEAMNAGSPGEGEPVKNPNRSIG